MGSVVEMGGSRMKLDDAALDQLFRNARSQNGWMQNEVPDSLLHELHDVMKWGPTSANCWPMRVIFVKSTEAKSRLLTCVLEGNLEKVRTAPVTKPTCVRPVIRTLPRLTPGGSSCLRREGNAIRRLERGLSLSYQKSSASSSRE